MGKVYVWHPGWKPGRIFDASCVKAAQPILGSVVGDFEVIGYCLTVIAVTKDHLMEWLFEMEVLHGRSYPAARWLTS